MSKRKQLKETRSILDKAQLSSERTGVELFAAGVAHEFNNVLGAALGHAEWALDSGDPADMKDALELVVKACERAREITWALKGLAQPREERFGEIKVSHLCKKLETLMQSFLAVDKIHSELCCADSSLKFFGDENQIIEILMNLVSNSRDSLIANGSLNRSNELKISVDVSYQAGHVLIKVSDNGHGVPEALREMIFRPFFTTKGVLAHVSNAQHAHQRGGGMGLGLYLSRNVAREHGGDLILSTDHPSSFVLKVPASS